MSDSKCIPSISKLLSMSDLSRNSFHLMSCNAQRRWKRSKLKQIPNGTTQNLVQKKAKSVDQSLGTNNGVSKSCTTTYGVKVEVDKKSAAQDFTSVSISPLKVKVPSQKKRNEYEAEYEMNNISSAVIEYIVFKGITEKYIKGISGASVSVRGIVSPDKRLNEKPLHLLVQGPTKRSVHLAIQLIKFLRTKGEKIKSATVLKKNKIVVRKIAENKCQENDKKIIKLKMQEIMLKKQDKLPGSFFRESETSDVKVNAIEGMLESLQTDEGKELFIVNNRIEEETGTTSQEEKLDEKKESIDEKTQDEIRRKNSQIEFFNCQHVYLDNSESIGKRVKERETLNEIQGIKQGLKIENCILNVKENESFKANNNAMNKAPGFTEEGQHEIKRKYGISEQNKRKKSKLDTKDDMNNNEFKKEKTSEPCLVVEKKYRKIFEVKKESQTLMEKLDVDLDDAPAYFDVVSRVKGPGGQYLQYISDCSQTIITLKGRGSRFLEPSTGRESIEPLHICIEYFHSQKDPRLISKAKRLVTELIAFVKRDYQQFCQQSVESPSDPACEAMKCSSLPDLEQLRNSTSLQYSVSQDRTQQISPPNHPSQYKSNSSPNMDSLQTPTRQAVFHSPMNGINRIDTVPPTSSCSSTFWPIEYPVPPITVEPAMSRAQLVTTVQEISTQMSPSGVDAALHRVSIKSNMSQFSFAPLPNLGQSLPPKTIQAPLLSRGSQSDQPLNKIAVLKPSTKVPSGSSAPASTLYDSTFIEPQFSQEALSPSSQSPFVSTPSETQFFHTPPANVVPHFFQPPLFSTASETQFSQKLSPNVVPHFSQPPLDSTASESQLLLKPPPSVLPPTISSQYPSTCTPSESQIFRKSPPSVFPHFPQSSLDSVGFNQHPTQMLSQSSSGLSHFVGPLLFSSSPISQEPVMNLLCNTNFPQSNFCQPNTMLPVNSSTPQYRLLSTVLQAQLVLTPPCQSSIESKVSQQQWINKLPFYQSSMQSTPFQSQLTVDCEEGVCSPPSQSTNSPSQQVYSYHPQTESFIFRPQLAQSSQLRRPLQSTTVSSYSFSQFQPEQVQFLSTTVSNSEVHGTLLPTTDIPKPVPPLKPHLLQQRGLQCSSNIKPKRKVTRWDVEHTVQKSIVQCPVAASTPTTEQLTSKETSKQELSFVDEISHPVKKRDMTPPETLSIQNSNTNESTLELGSLMKTLENMLDSLKGVLQEGLLKTKITQIASLAEYISINGNNVEESEHQKKKIMFIVQDLDKVFKAHQDNGLTKFLPILNQLKQIIGIRNISNSKQPVPLRNEKPLSVKSPRPHRMDKFQGQSKTSRKKSESTKSQNKYFYSQLKPHLQRVVSTLGAQISSETKQIRKIMLTEQHSVLKHLKENCDEIPYNAVKAVMRILGDLEKHASGPMLASIKVLKQLLQDSTKILDQKISLDLPTPEQKAVKTLTVERKPSTNIWPNEASPTEIDCPKLQTSEEKLLSRDVNKQTQQTLGKQVLPDLVLRTRHECSTGVDSVHRTGVSYSSCDSEDQQLRHVTEILGGGMKAFSHINLEAKPSMEVNKLTDQIIQVNNCEGS